MRSSLVVRKQKAGPILVTGPSASRGLPGQRVLVDAANRGKPRRGVSDPSIVKNIPALQFLVCCQSRSHVPSRDAPACGTAFVSRASNQGALLKAVIIEKFIMD